MATPGKDKELVTVSFQGETLQVKNKFKIWKFFKTLEKSPFEAIDMILTDESVAKLEEMEFTMPELGELLNDITKALGSLDLKN